MHGFCGRGGVDSKFCGGVEKTWAVRKLRYIKSCVYIWYVKALKASSAVILISIGILTLSEGFLRLAGYRPFSPLFVAQSISPEGMFAPDSVVGYGLSPGTYTLQLRTGLRFTATHTATGQRITRPTQLALSDNAARLHIYGDSYLYGFGLPDTATMAWQLQQHAPYLQVENYAVPGHSAVGCWLKLQQHLATGTKPWAAVFIYASYDTDREVFNRFTQRNIRINRRVVKNFTYPYIEAVDNSYRVVYASLGKRGINLANLSALYNAAETYCLERDRQSYPYRAINQWLFDTLVNTCMLHDVKPVLLFVTDDEMSQKAFERYQLLGATCIQATYNLQSPRYSLLPYDNHPNAHTHRLYAHQLLSLFSRTYCSDTAIVSLSR